ncbi:TPA: spore coat U domain-containing protein [Serratia marcescens]|uniref:Spore coat protein U domain-containing protein n=1 Tax=Serratia marcescens TaxID=615 RepID=A0A5C7CDL3_SERMA|nr:spore coat U domain-containing protein [Serratia marcescens]ELA7781379.1 spore coat protein U domain-containing protein [Serratia marcescens]MBH3126880.1 spore coat protein U domain-containing protein [Serratia marcescens]MBH3278405.1 spore coat protein U domain-containing protein [Serratia marcescens]TXE35989.1 spore coat protein U domain-containing protein [Serratia marcescens]TXE60395.1 spore coat protein U domain-containing protein [Serratia marcescens]
MRRALCCCGLWACSLLAQADSKTATLGVSATLLSACEAGSSSGGNVSFGTLNFGTLYFLSTATSIAGQQNAGAIRVKCTNGTSYSVLLGGGQSGNTAARYLQSAAGQRVNYNLYTNAAHSAIWDNLTGVSQTANGADNWLPVYGMIPAQSTPPTGSYTDTVQVTINW